MMSQINGPIYRYKNPVIYYKLKINEYEKKRFGNFYLANKTSYIDSDRFLTSSFYHDSTSLNYHWQSFACAKLDLILIIFLANIVSANNFFPDEVNVS